ncbi:uncharacterized protein isoform X2 [Rhodnius prolixus]|uniref:uncharacterized protein isoform X2 n=1 Tax=Rhodnius prolixus TaxID=13249 RepID=UPI003D18F53C
MSVIWTPLRLVMEENERKEIQESQLVGTSSQLRHEHIKNVTRKEHFFKEDGAGDCNNSMREMDTLPFRTGLIRARFQSQIDESENAVNKLTTTALVERPPLQFKEEFEQRKQRFLNEDQVDRPDDAGATEYRNYVSFRNTTGSDCKERPLTVGLPEINKTQENDIIDTDSIPLAQQYHGLPDEALKTSSEDLTDSKNEVDQEKDDDCLVNCIYYTQQFCDCCIL